MFFTLGNKKHKQEPTRICGINLFFLLPHYFFFPSLKSPIDSPPILLSSLLPTNQLTYFYLLSILNALLYRTLGIIYPGKLQSLP